MMKFPMGRDLAPQPRIAALVLACASLSCLAPPAGAQTGATAKPQSAGPSKAVVAPAQGRVLTPAQLKDCLAQQAVVEREAAEADRERTAIEAIKNELKASGPALDSALAALDRSDPAAVEAHNAKVRERDARIDGYEARVAAYNGRAEGLKTTRDAWVKACDGRRYDERDLQDLMKKTR